MNTKSDPLLSDAAELRRRAEAALVGKEASSKESLASLTPEALQALLHQLYLHQTELEMQNEELRRAQVDLHSSRSRYLDLFELAPVGYCTVREHGLIIEANVTLAAMLGLSQGELAAKPFFRFIFKDDQDAYYALRKQVLESLPQVTPGSVLRSDVHGHRGQATEAQTRELRMVKGDGSSFWAKLVVAANRDEEGEVSLRFVVNDIHARKQFEAVQSFFAQAGSVTVSEPFFNRLARHLAETLAMDYVCIDRLETEGLYARTLAVWCDGRFEDNVTYALKDTPCGAVVVGELCCYPAGVIQSFPQDLVLQDLRAESYIGMTLRDHAGRPIGLIAVIGRKPIADRALAENLIRLVCLRAGAELERLMAEEALAREKDRLRYLVENTPAVIYTSRASGDFGATYVSANVTLQMGYRPDEFTGAADFWIKGVHPEDLSHVHAHLRTLRESGASRYEYRFRHSDGTYHWMFDEARLVRDDAGQPVQIVGSWLDITDRKQAEESLRERELRLSLAIRGGDLGLWDWNAGTGQFTVNDRWLSMLGLDLQGAMPTVALWHSLLHPDDLPKLDELFRTVILSPVGTDLEIEVRARHRDGHYIWILSKGRIVERTANGSPLRVVGTHMDITARKRAEQEKMTAEARLRESQKMESIGQLSGGIAHDFNNLLTVILGNASILREDQNLPMEMQQELLQEITQAGNRAAGLTRQLLLFSRREVPVRHTVDLNQVVNEMLKMLHRVLGEMIEIEQAFSAKPLLIDADTGMLNQILLNLAVNARDAMPGGGKLSIATSEVTIGADPETGRLIESPSRGRRDEESRGGGASSPGGSRARAGHFACLAVTDAGCGMSRELIEHIFEPFFTTKEVGKGTGLGLPTVLGIVQMHQGWIELESQPGAGSTFRVFLPLLQTAPLHGAPPLSATDPVATGQGETILVVEDEGAVRSLLSGLLDRSGYRVLNCSTGAKALELWPQHREDVRLLISDVVMPGGVNGLELAQKLLADRPDLKVIIISGYNTKASDIRLMEGLNVEFVDKPFDLNRLLTTIRGLLNSARSSKG